MSPQPPAPQQRPPRRPGWLSRLARLRKVYHSQRELRRDRWIGVIAFIALNGLVYLTMNWLASHGGLAHFDASSNARIVDWIVLLPWLANGLLVLLTFAFRPQIAIGYLFCFGAILMVSGLLFVALVASCLVSIPVILVSPTLGAVVFFGALIVGTIWGLWKLFAVIQGWWQHP